MRRVVITGMGIISSIGNTLEEVEKSLYNGSSGIVFAEDYKEMGFRSHVKGNINVNLQENIDRRLLRFMGDGAAYAYLSMQQAINDSGLENKDVSNVKSGLVVGSGGPSTSNMMKSFDTAREKKPKTGWALYGS
jgi:3-oxoacyl-[acyl-carrier-protein] synthase-1